MAAAKKPPSLLAIMGEAPEGETDSEESTSTPKGRAMKAMWEDLQAGKFEEAGHQFKMAYDLCADAGADYPDDEGGSLLEEE